MFKKYCLIDSENKFLDFFDDNELTESEKSSCVFTVPPTITNSTIAIWKDDSWLIKRKNVKDKLNETAPNNIHNLKFEKIKEEVEINNVIIPQRRGNYISTKQLLSMLNKEKNNYTRVIVELCMEKKKINKILKNYVKELDEIIEYYKKQTVIYTPFRFNLNDNEFDLGELLDNKYEADIIIENLSEDNT